MQITEEQIRKIAISHQRQMTSVHPHAIIASIEDAINEALIIAGVVEHSEQLPDGYCKWCKQTPCERLNWSHPLEDDGE